MTCFDAKKSFRAHASEHFAVIGACAQISPHKYVWNYLLRTIKYWFESGLALLLLSYAFIATSYAHESALSTGYDHLMMIANSNKESQEKTIEIQGIYDRLFGKYQSNELATHLSDDDLELLYRASNLAVFYVQRKEYVRHMRMDIDALQKRGLVNQRHYVDLYGAYVSLRMFDDARGLIGRHELKHVEEIPNITVMPLVDGVPKAFLVEKKSDNLRLQSVNIGSGIRIVVVSHPLCHFSQNAVSYIEADASLKKVFDQYALWLIGPSRNIEFNLIQSWSLDHPNGSTMLAYSREDWPMIKTWDTPAFYFFKEGNLIDTVVGWPRQGNGTALRAALRKVGLDPEE